MVSIATLLNPWESNGILMWILRDPMESKRILGIQVNPMKSYRIQANPDWKDVNPKESKWIKTNHKEYKRLYGIL